MCHSFYQPMGGLPLPIMHHWPCDNIGGGWGVCPPHKEGRPPPPNKAVPQKGRPPGRQTPPPQVGRPPGKADPPGRQTISPREYGQWRMVSILLECILVFKYVLQIILKNKFINVLAGSNRSSLRHTNHMIPEKKTKLIVQITLD